jgi:DNA polymerase elongation subunit (family B)
VLTYCCHDVKETAKLAEIVAPTEFYMAQMVPDSYGASALAGQGEKINSILIRAYLAQGRGIPRPNQPKPYPGGYTEVRMTGVIDRVVKADVESLYPSLMLAEMIKPASDTLNVFLPALAELTERRLDAKSRARVTQGTDQHYWDGLQGSFKVLINSFYGYLGAPSFNFNDYAAAERVTVRGQEIVKQIADRLEVTGSRVIEIDTDGVYFVPPETVQGEEAEQRYVAEIGSALPSGIRLAFDGRYRSMVSLKTKNYVLWGYDGKTRFTGASLRSRADERYGRHFISRVVDLLLERRPEETGELYKRTIDDLLNHRIPIQDLARRERVTEKTFTSASKSRSAEVARDLAVGEYVTVYERKNGQLGLLEDYEANGRDERVEYYADKLYKFANRLREAFDSDFDRLIPRPGSDGSLPPVQEALDLFS